MHRWLLSLALLSLGCTGTLDSGDGGDRAIDGSLTPDGGGFAPDGSSPHDGGGPVDAFTPPDAFVPFDGGPSSGRQTMRPLGSTDAPNGFYEYLPPGYDAAHPAPLLVFWHGLGEDGDGSAAQLPAVLRNGPPALISRDQWPSDRPFIVLSPQNASSCPSADGVRDFLRWAFAHYSVDRSRVYLTGLSCGAIGVWSYLAAHLDDGEITAAVTIAGNGRAAWSTHHCDLGQIGIWALHGTADETIDPDDEMFTMTGFPTDDRPDFDRNASVQAYADWLAAGSPMDMGLLACPSRRDARLTLYPDVGHDSWTRTYDGSAGHDVYAWMLSMSR